MTTMNCWEFKGCGRGLGGAKIAELGICPAATAVDADGFLGGTNGGKACAYLAGTLCGGKVQGVYATKLRGCFECDFFRQLQGEHREGMNAMSFVKHAAKRNRA